MAPPTIARARPAPCGGGSSPAAAKSTSTASCTSFGERIERDDADLLDRRVHLACDVDAVARAGRGGNGSSASRIAGSLKAWARARRSLRARLDRDVDAVGQDVGHGDRPRQQDPRRPCSWASSFLTGAPRSEARSLVSRSSRLCAASAATEAARSPQGRCAGSALPEDIAAERRRERCVVAGLEGVAIGRRAAGRTPRPASSCASARRGRPRRARGASARGGERSNRPDPGRPRRQGPAALPDALSTRITCRVTASKRPSTVSGTPSRDKGPAPGRRRRSAHIVSRLPHGADLFGRSRGQSSRAACPCLVKAIDHAVLASRFAPGARSSAPHLNLGSQSHGAWPLNDSRPSRRWPPRSDCRRRLLHRRRVPARLSPRRAGDRPGSGRHRAASRCCWPSARPRPCDLRQRECLLHLADVAAPGRLHEAEAQTDQRVLAVYFDEDSQVEQHRQLRHAGRQGVRLHLAHHADRRQGPELPRQPCSRGGHRLAATACLDPARSANLAKKARALPRGFFVAGFAVVQLCASTASSSSATMLVILIAGFTAGPAVSL